MYMRLGFAVATSIRPDILITDEVLAVGDEAFQKKCIRRMEAFLGRGKRSCSVRIAPTTSASCARKPCGSTTAGSEPGGAHLR